MGDLAFFCMKSSRGSVYFTHVIAHNWIAYFKCSMAAAAAAAAKSLQSCPTLCDPIDGSPPGSAVPGILQARTLEWVAISGLAYCTDWDKSVHLNKCFPFGYQGGKEGWSKLGDRD